MCETWYSTDDILALVPGATRVVAVTAYPPHTEEDGTTVIPCFWDVQRNPQPTEPFFDWVMYLRWRLTIKGDGMSPTQWDKRLATAPCRQPLGCSPNSALLAAARPDAVTEQHSTAGRPR